MIEEVRVTALHCICDLCGNDWTTLAKRPPEKCPNEDCKARKWNGQKKNGRPKLETLELVLPRPERKPI